MELMQDQDTEVFWDEIDAVNYMVWDDQWVSFDTNVTFQQKVEYANTKCLGGLMIWSVDQDTYDWQALSGLLGKSVASNNLLSGGTLGDSDKKDLSRIYSAFTGTDCYVSECFYWNSGWCETGYSTLDYVHQGLYGIIADPDTMTCATGEEGDTDAQYRMICCPTDAMPESCAWAGSTVSDQCGGSGCTSGQYELVADSYVDRTGSEKCAGNPRPLCCNTDSALEKCSWSMCGQGCNSTDYTFATTSPYGGASMLATIFPVTEFVYVTVLIGDEKQIWWNQWLNVPLGNLAHFVALLKVCSLWSCTLQEIAAYANVPRRHLHRMRLVRL